MAYSKSKAEKIKQECNNSSIIGKPFLFIDGGKEYKIEELVVDCTERLADAAMMSETDLEKGDFWDVKVKVRSKDSNEQVIELKKVLKHLKIKHNLESIK